MCTSSSKEERGRGERLVVEGSGGRFICCRRGGIGVKTKVSNQSQWTPVGVRFLKFTFQGLYLLSTQNVTHDKTHTILEHDRRDRTTPVLRRETGLRGATSTRGGHSENRPSP